MSALPHPILLNYLKIDQVLEAIYFIEDECGCRSKEPDYHVSVRRGERVCSLAQDGAFENQNPEIRNENAIIVILGWIIKRLHGGLEPSDTTFRIMVSNFMLHR